MAAATSLVMRVSMHPAGQLGIPPRHPAGQLGIPPCQTSTENEIALWPGMKL